MSRLALALLLAQLAFAQLPGFYKKVDRLTWVVKDIDKVAGGWEKLGFGPVLQYGEVEAPQAEYRGGAGRGKPGALGMRVAAARLGDVQVNWIQPLGGDNAYSDFLARHGDGIFSLVHRAATLDEFNAELDRAKSLGVPVLQSLAVDTGEGWIRIAHLDTERGGKYSLGLIHFPPEAEATANLPPGNSGRVVTQFAFVARDTHAASAYWNKLGFPEMSFTHGPLTNLKYRGQAGQFDQELGWQRHGGVVYEWIQPLKGPTVYEDHLKTHGEGIHHLAFNVDDMDKAIAEWTAKGFAVSQSGGWGEEGKPGSGRFAYIDTDAIGGVTIELLWNFRAR